jgi:hypothetical protein
VQTTRSAHVQHFVHTETNRITVPIAEAARLVIIIDIKHKIWNEIYLLQ